MARRINLLPSPALSAPPALRAQARWSLLLAVVLAAWPFSGRLQAADDPRGVELFNQTVQPLLRGQCHACHSHQAKKHSGGLVLDSRAAMLAGGETGPAVVPGKPEESWLVNAIRRDENFVQMPPKSKLAEAEVAAIVEWIKLGAPWPGDTGKTAGRLPGKITDEDRQWWAFRPVAKVVPPPTQDSWTRNEIDAFVADKLRHAELTPAPEASRAVVIRRLYFDLWGMPPTPDEVAAFEQDRAADAYERLVDRLLAGPRYGEHWARHWLDLVRYADSDGYRIDDYRPTAWHYRDYVINALNADKPYDRFVQEQLAGDELFPGVPEARIATGYLRHWIYEYNSRDVPGQWSIILNDITDTTGDVFLGLGLQCARCHDHKFDPLLQKDYFRLQAFFAPLLPRDDLAAATDGEVAEYQRKLAQWEPKTTDLRRQLAELEEPIRQKAATGAVIKFPEEIQAMIHKPVAERLPLEHQLAELAYRQVTYEFDHLDRQLKGDTKEKIFALRKELTALEKDKPAAPSLVMSVTDVGPLAPAVTIPKKGNTPIEPGYLTILDDKPAEIAPLPASSRPGAANSGPPASTGRRAALARWLTRPDNPLTGRVMVNRVWQYHFGHGLAANASDFGRLGSPPSHPELLDWLSARFVSDGWSLKRLHRLILTSATYRQSAEHPQAELGRLRDPENRLLWRGSVRRLDAEQIRDTLFAVTGELNAQAGGPGVPNTEPRRAIYTRIMRNVRDPLLDVFDAPFWFSSASSRDTTTTPVQSLLLINSQLMLQRAKALAGRLMREEPSGIKQRIQRAYQLAYSRSATAEEVASGERFIRDQAKRILPEEAGSAQAGFLYGKLPYRDGQAAMCTPAGPQRGFQVMDPGRMPAADFTIEAFVLLRSIYPSGEVRTIAAKWDGDVKHAGWKFGVTGKGSRRKPQTLVMQFFGEKLAGGCGEDAIFSDQHIQLDKPYYLAAAVKLAQTDAAGSKPGSVTFYVKDLSNDDEPLLIATASHEITGGLGNKQPLGIGNISTGNRSFFDGLIDDVRLSDAALGIDQLLFTNEGTNRNTVGYWQFEAKPDVFADSSGHSLDIQPAGRSTHRDVDVQEAALADFCHVLFNTSEFLYVE